MLKKIIGIDFGTSTIKIFKNKEGIILDEKNVIAIYKKDKVLAAGNEAFEMYEKTPENIQVSYPVNNGVIADIGKMQMLMEYFFNRLSTRKRNLKGATYYMAIPTEITEVEKRAYFDLINHSNLKAKKVCMVEKPVADAVGMGLEVMDAHGTMVVDIGANTTEISILSLGGIVLSKLIPIGGSRFDESIALMVRKEYNYVIGSKTAEIIKKELASAIPIQKTIKVYGRNLVTGLPGEIEIDSAQVYETIQDHLQTIIDAMKMILERTPPEISSDIIGTGVNVTGGSSRIHGLDVLIQRETGLAVNIHKDPENTVILGLGAIIENPDLTCIVSSLKQTDYSEK